MFGQHFWREIFKDISDLDLVARYFTNDLLLYLQAFWVHHVGMPSQQMIILWWSAFDTDTNWAFNTLCDADNLLYNSAIWFVIRRI